MTWLRSGDHKSGFEAAETRDPHSQALRDQCGLCLTPVVGREQGALLSHIPVLRSAGEPSHCSQHHQKRGGQAH